MVMRILRTNTLGADVFSGTEDPEIIYGWDPNAAPTPLTIDAIRIASNLSEPLFATAPATNTSHLFLVEKAGLIKILNLATGQIGAIPFLDVASHVATAGEQGLLGLAFHPDFAQNRKVFVYLSTADGDVELRQYQTSTSNPDVVDPSSERLVLRIDFPTTTNHRGGWIGFGLDGYLYAAVGDGASSNNAQSLNSSLGKILRIDVNGSDAYPSDPNRNYAVPVDNPTQFDGLSGSAQSAVYAIGLRNPWRASFDATGRLFIADVGAAAFEEVNLGRAGANYGWGRGTGQDDGPISPPDPSYTNPIFFYGRGAQSASITGGYVYRGPNQELKGQYVFGDFVRGTIMTLTQEGGHWQATDRTTQIQADAGTIDNISSFAEDASGSLYVLDFDGDIFRLDPKGGRARDLGDRLSGNGGDDIIFGGDGSDRLSGGAGADRLDGGPGNDRLDGGVGNDVMVGRAGRDTLIAKSGADVLNGGPSQDNIYTGWRDEARDRVVYAALSESGVTSAGRDQVFQFLPGQDKIDLRPIDANPSLAGNQAFKVVSEFTRAHGEVRLLHTASGDTIVQVDGDRDTAVDMTIRVVGAHLSSVDLLL